MIAKTMYIFKLHIYLSEKNAICIQTMPFSYNEIIDLPSLIYSTIRGILCPIRLLYIIKTKCKIIKINLIVLNFQFIVI